MAVAHNGIRRNDVDGHLSIQRSIEGCALTSNGDQHGIEGETVIAGLQIPGLNVAGISVVFGVDPAFADRIAAADDSTQGYLHQPLGTGAGLLPQRDPFIAVDNFHIADVFSVCQSRHHREHDAQQQK